jgi:hypothetical protein
LPFTALPVDVAVSPDGARVAFATAGDRAIHVVPRTSLSGGETGPCEPPPVPPEGETPPGDVAEFGFFEGRGMPTSVDFTADGRLVVFYPEQPAVVLVRLETFGGTTSEYINLSGGPADDVGRTLFHQATFAGLACASCHPEARDDGQVWDFRELGPRRTQNISGSILSRAPYHWTGDMTNLRMLLDEVMVGRMGGNPVGPIEEAAIGQWLDRLPAPSPGRIRDREAVARGKALFDSEDVGCAGCHTGALLTSNMIVDVGTGGLFKVPSLLGIATRPPFLHDGCAETLMDRFTTCGSGDAHGATSHLAESDLTDLVAYLNTL